jgi:quinol monooxygenase YgiN
MHIIIWEFAVHPEHIEEFVAAYRSDGDWAELFRRAEGYLGTELLRSSHASNIFLTIDRWKNASSFETFKQKFGLEYNQLDARFERYTLSEKKLGAFSEA